MMKLPTEDEQYFAYRDEIQFHLDLFNKYAEYLYLSNKPAPTGIQFVLSYQAEDPQRMVCIIPNLSPVLVTYPKYGRGSIPSNDEIVNALLIDAPPEMQLDRIFVSKCLTFSVLVGLGIFALGFWKVSLALWVLTLAVYGQIARVYNKNITIKRPTFTAEDLTEACLGQARSLEELKLLCPTVKLMSQSIIRYIRDNVPKEYHETMQLPPREISEIKKDSQWNPFT